MDDALRIDESPTIPREEAPAMVEKSPSMVEALLDGAGPPDEGLVNQDQPEPKKRKIVGKEEAAMKASISGLPMIWETFKNTARSAALSLQESVKKLKGTNRQHSDAG